MVGSANAAPAGPHPVTPQDSLLGMCRPGAKPPTADQPEQGTPGRRVPALLVAGGAALVVGLGGAPFCAKLLARPLVSLGLTTVTTAAVVKRAWRRSGRGQSPGENGNAHPLRRIIARHRPQLVKATVLSTLAQLGETVVLSLASTIVLTLARSEGSILARLALTGATGQLTTLVVAAVLVSAVRLAVEYAAGTAWHSLGQAVEEDWRTRTYAQVQRVAPATLEDERTNKVTSVLTEDIGQLGTFVGSTLHDAVQLATSFAVLIPAYLLYAPQIAWVAFAPIPLVTWLSFRFHERAMADHAVSGAHKALLTGRIADNLQAHTTVKASRTEEYEVAGIAALSKNYREAQSRTGRSAAAQAQIVRVGGISGMAATLFLGGRAVLRGQLPVKVFGPLIDMPAHALWRLTRLGSITDQYQRTLAALDRVQHLHDLPVESDAGTHSVAVDQVKGAIEVHDVTFAYPGRPPILRDTSLYIAPGQVTGIVGTSGAGKTTIAKLLMRFRQADSGQVLIDGVDVSALSLPDLRRAIGYVSQEPFLFDATIAENIRYGTFDATDEELVAAARTAGADAFVNALPEGYGTLVGERGAALSGGQKQRIALARTILRDPPVVILDEATSAVDNETEAAIQGALQRFSVNRTMVVIAHRLSTVRSADQIYVLGAGGVVVEQGKHDDLVSRGGTYTTLWSLQAGHRELP